MKMKQSNKTVERVGQCAASAAKAILECVCNFQNASAAAGYCSLPFMLGFVRPFIMHRTRYRLSWVACLFLEGCM
jgi:hypothetical protein